MTTAKTKMLPVQLTDDEVALKAQELAKSLAEYDELELKVKATAADGRSRLKAMREAFTNLRRQVASRTEERPVEVFEEANHVRRSWIIFRADTGEEVGSRPMTEEDLARERQLDIEGPVRPRGPRVKAEA